MERQAVGKVQKTPSRANHVQTQSARSPSAGHPLLELQRSIGNEAVQRLISSPYIQAKLQISTPGDPFEQEADRVADTVMRMAEPSAGKEDAQVQANPQTPRITPLVQRETERPLEEEKEETVAAKPLVQLAPLGVREDDDEKKVAPKLTASPTPQEEEKETTIATKPLVQREPLAVRDDDEEEKIAPKLETSPSLQEEEEETTVATKPLVQREPLAVREDDDEEEVAPKLDSSPVPREEEKAESVQTKSATDPPLQRQTREDEERKEETPQTAPPIQRRMEAEELLQTRLFASESSQLPGISPASATPAGLSIQRLCAGCEGEQSDTTRLGTKSMMIDRGTQLQRNDEPGAAPNLTLSVREEAPRIQAESLAPRITPLVQRKSEQPLEEEKEKAVADNPVVQRAPLAVREDDEEEKVAPKLESDSDLQEDVQENKLQAKSEVGTDIQRQTKGDEEKKEEGLEIAPPIQRQKADEDQEATATIQRLCTDCEGERQLDNWQRGERVQRKFAPAQLRDEDELEKQQDQPRRADAFAQSVMTSVAANIRRLQGGGSPLPPATRAFFEPRFGADFSQVRVHTDEQAAKTARAIKARAFTTGRDMAFAAGEYAPNSQEGRRLLAHELTHIVQQAYSAPLAEPGESAIPRRVGGQLVDALSRRSAVSIRRQLALTVQRDTGAGSPGGDGATVGSTSIEYNGNPLAPVNKGTLLTADPERIDSQLRSMIIKNGAPKMTSWVSALDGWLTQGNPRDLAEQQKKYGTGDVSGAPDPAYAVKQRVVFEFKKARSKWEATINDIAKRFDQEIIAAVNGVLDLSEKQIFKEATRYGISPDPTGNKIRPTALSSVVPVPPERQALKKTAQEILVAWKRKDQEKQTAQGLLTPPWKLIEIEKRFANLRRDKVQQFPILAAYARNREKLQELVAEKDPAANIEKEINKKLDNIAYVRAEKDAHRNQFKLDPKLRNAAKKSMLVPSASVEERVIDDQVQGIQEDAAFMERLKSAVGFGLLILSFVPGAQLVALAGGLALMGADILGKFEDYLWEEAASGSAFDRAAAISQSDPSLYKLGLEIALGLGQGVVEATAISAAVKTFKVLAPVVRDALVARAAARTARTAASSQAAAEALARVEQQGGEGLGKRLKDAVERGEFAKDESAIAEAARATSEGGQSAAAGKGKVVKGLPDAFGGETHSVRITRQGNIRCSSPYCMELADSIVHRLEQLGLENLTEGQRGKGSGLAKRAREAKAEARTVEEGTPAEEALAQKVEQIETEMVGLEREAGMILRKRLGTTRDYVGELQSVRVRVSTMRGRHQGKPGFGEIQKQCDGLLDRADSIQNEMNKIQRDLETPGQTPTELAKHQATVDAQLKGLDQLKSTLGGIEREQLSQLQALGEGAELYGKSDADTRSRLAKKLKLTEEQVGKISDTVAKRRDGSWIATESKGGNIDDALAQLTNTIHHLIQAEPAAKGRIDARITVTSKAFEDYRSNTAGGFKIDEGGRLLRGPAGAEKPVTIPGTRGSVVVQRF